MKYSTVVQLNEIQKILPHSCLTFTEALELAFQKISQNEVVSTWMDSWELHGQDPNIADYVQVPTEGCLIDQRKVFVKDSKSAATERIWRIGGNNGYYAFNWIWYLRGLFDQMIGGVGLNRGRRDPNEIKVGDSIDFWRVLLVNKDKSHLILYATMKVPGEAWLEFRLEQPENQWMVVQTATFRPKGMLGRVYWIAMYPFHCFIFRKMAKAIAGRLQ